MEFLQFSLDLFWKIFLSSISFYLIYKLFFANKKKSYLQDLNIPFCERNVGLFQLMFFKTNMHEQEMKYYKDMGRIYGAYEINKNRISIAEPELIRKILIKDFNVFTDRINLPPADSITGNILNFVQGEKWKRIRTIISPSFTTGKIKRMADIIIDSAETLIKNLSANTGKPIHLKEFYNTFTLDVIASTAFGTKLNSFEDPNNLFLQAVKPVFSGKISWELILFILFPSVARIFKMGFFPRKTVEFLKKETLEIIRYRKKTGKVYNDFLQLMLDAEKESKEQNDHENVSKNIDDQNAEELGHDEDNKIIFKASKTYKSLSEDEMLAQCVLFFIAGYETTSSTITMASYLLSKNPEAQEKLRDEVDFIISKHGKVTYEATQEMKYLDNVVTETLRLYPPLVRLDRVASSDYELEGTGITIKKDTVVSVPVYAIHRDPEFYAEPEKFKPERFTPEEKAKRHPYTYLAFGAGPRNCVAMRFALMEVKLCLAHVISQFKLSPNSENEDDLRVESGLGILQPKVSFKIEQRSNCVNKDYD